MSQNQKIILGVAVVGVGVVALLIFKGNFFQPANVGSTLQRIAVADVQKEQPPQNEQLPREINVKAFKFGYEPNIIKVTKGEKIKINIDNADVPHGIRIPDLKLSGNDVLEFTADQVGEFTWYCANMCGEGHGAMQGKLIVEDSALQNLNQLPVQLVQIVQPIQKPDQVFFGDKGENLTLRDGVAEIPANVFASQKALFYNVVLDSGKTVYFFVVKDKNGKYRAAANTCQVCYGAHKGFRQEGNEMVCNNCGNRYPMEKIATEKGGCNPAPISPDLEVKDGKVIIKQAELEEVAGLF